MKDKQPKAPPVNEPEEPTPLERMVDLTRRVLEVRRDEAREAEIETE